MVDPEFGLGGSVSKIASIKKVLGFRFLPCQGLSKGKHPNNKLFDFAKKEESLGMVDLGSSLMVDLGSSWDNLG